MEKLVAVSSGLALIGSLAGCAAEPASTIPETLKVPES